MRNFFKWYFDDWIKIMFRPIYFYTFMEKGPLSGKSFTFLLVSSWIFAAGAAAVGYCVVILPMLANLIAGIAGIKFLLVLPVFTLLSLIFFAMILLMAGAGVVVFALASLAMIAVILHYAVSRLGGEGRLQETIKSLYYSSAVLLPALLLPFIGLLTKYKAFPFDNFMVGANIIIYMTIMYLWGLWSIAAKKVYKVSRAKAVLASLTVIILVILLQVFVGLKIIPKLGKWIG